MVPMRDKYGFRNLAQVHSPFATAILKNNLSCGIDFLCISFESFCGPTSKLLAGCLVEVNDIAILITKRVETGEQHSCMAVFPCSQCEKGKRVPSMGSSSPDKLYKKGFAY